ncbi:hypothetical protein [Mesorhizobium sp. ORM16]
MTGFRQPTAHLQHIAADACEIVDKVAGINADFHESGRFSVRA